MHLDRAFVKRKTLRCQIREGSILNLFQRCIYIDRPVDLLITGLSPLLIKQRTFFRLKVNYSHLLPAADIKRNPYLGVACYRCSAEVSMEY
ncbi:hypothetical protein D3C77_298380 [compost metagenome]